MGPYLTKVAIDRHIARGDAAGLAGVAGLYLLALAGAFVVRFGQNYIMQMTGQRIMQDMRREIFAHLQRLHVGYFDRNPVGRLMTRVTTDVDAVNELFTSGVVTVFGDLFTLLGIMAVMLALDWRLALVTFAVIPLFFAPHQLVPQGRAAVLPGDAEVGRPHQRLPPGEPLRHVGGAAVPPRGEEPRGLRRDQPEALRRQPAGDLLLRGLLPGDRAPRRARHRAHPRLRGRRGPRRGAHPRRAGGLHPVLGAVLAADLGPLGEVQRAAGRDGRVRAHLRLARHEGDRGQPRAPRPPGRDTGPGELRGRVVLLRGGRRRLARREDAAWVLRDIDFAVEPGRSVALVGATGAGKTSIISLLMRFYDVQRGRVALDGVDVRDWDVRALRSALALVLQDVHLFSGTIASNIRLGSDIPMERVRAAAEAVHAHRFIETLPKGYDTEVKERGATLSVGQKQLLSFARALAHDPRVLILDEATSSVDTETEQLIQDALRVLLQGRTAIVIAHRLSTVQNVDEILVLHKGRIRERGTHQELLARRGMYWRLYELQYKDQEARGQAPAEASA